MPFLYPPPKGRQVFLWFVIGGLVFACFFFFYITQWLQTFQKLPARLVIHEGNSLLDVVHSLEEEGFSAPPIFVWLVLYYNASFGSANKTFRAGAYDFSGPLSLLDLSKKIFEGRVILSRLRIDEGWTFARLRDAINAHPDLLHKTKELDLSSLLQKIQSTTRQKEELSSNIAGAMQNLETPEGLFFPDTYFFPPGTSDLDVYRRAHKKLLKKLNHLWATQKVNYYKTPYEALILASIVQKESGVLSEQKQISGVFLNRLRKGIRLESNPTVNYLAGSNSSGWLSRDETKNDHPFNTYTRKGLPPAPICLVGETALHAALNPMETPAMYFVARGDGRHSIFSETYAEHSRAASKYYPKVWRKTLAPSQ